MSLKTEIIDASCIHYQKTFFSLIFTDLHLNADCAQWTEFVICLQSSAKVMCVFIALIHCLLF